MRYIGVSKTLIVTRLCRSITIPKNKIRCRCSLLFVILTLFWTGRYSKIKVIIYIIGLPDKSEFDSTNEVANMSKKINFCISLYKEQVNTGDIQKTYMFLLKYVMQVKASFEKSFSQVYSFGNVSPGYMD